MKVMIVGIDGAEPGKLFALVRQGKLPHIARFVAQGCFGAMHSSIPPISAPAWVSMMTGVHPGRHGIYDFVRSRPELSPAFQHQIARSTNIGCDAIWDYCRRAGKRLALVNVPVTYPPPQVDGVVVSGFDAPAGKADRFYPPDLGDRIARALGAPYRADYHPLSDWRGKNPLAWAEAYAAVEEERRQIVKMLLRDVRWDIFFSVFTLTDRIQHLFWGEDSLVDSAYVRMDDIVGDLVNEVGDDTLVLLVSDHGFGPYERRFFTNRWLAREGFLVFKGGIASWARGRSLAWRSVQLDRALTRLGEGKLARRLPERAARQRILTPVLRQRPQALVDWRRTRAYGSNYGIYVNLGGREPFGSVKKADYEDVRNAVIRGLSALVDEETGGLLVDSIHRREEIYEGPYLDTAPDVIFSVKNLAYLQSNAYTSSDVFGPAQLKGTHRLWGTFMAQGPGVRRNEEIKDVHIVDILPTVFYWLGLPIPADQDGRVLFECFEENYRAGQPVKMEDVQRKRGPKASGPHESEDYSDVEERLRALGYLD